jgi:hypothetical protein
MAIKEEKEESREIECGKRIGKLCSELFKEKYNAERIVKILLSLYKMPSYHFAFTDFPRDKYGDFEEGYLNNFAKGVYEHVKQTLENRDDDVGFFRYNLRSYVNAIFSNFLYSSGKVTNKPKQQIVNDKILTELRIDLNEPNLKTIDLMPLANKYLGEDERKLLDKIQKIPGYHNVWFKIIKIKRNGENIEVLCMFVTQEDILMKLKRFYGLSTQNPKHRNTIDDSYESNMENLVYGSDNYLEALPNNGGDSNGDYEQIPENYKFHNPSDIGEKQLSLEDRFENFYEILSEKEKCVYKYRIKKWWSLQEVALKCWGRTVSESNIQNVISNIRKKVIKEFLMKNNGIR